jgi:hypothetical protein
MVTGSSSTAFLGKIPEKLNWTKSPCGAGPPSKCSAPGPLVLFQFGVWSRRSKVKPGGRNRSTPTIGDGSSAGTSNTMLAGFPAGT